MSSALIDFIFASITSDIFSNTAHFSTSISTFLKRLITVCNLEQTSPSEFFPDFFSLFNSSLLLATTSIKSNKFVSTVAFANTFRAIVFSSSEEDFLENGPLGSLFLDAFLSISSASFSISLAPGTKNSLFFRWITFIDSLVQYRAFSKRVYPSSLGVNSASAAFKVAVSIAELTIDFTTSKSTYLSANNCLLTCSVHAGDFNTANCISLFKPLETNMALKILSKQLSVT